MKQIENRQIQLKSRPDGVPTEGDFEIAATALSPITDGEFLVKNEWMSVDPYMRGRMNDRASYVEPFALNEPLEGGCIGRVVASRHDRFTEGDCVLGNLGWREFWKSSGRGVVKVDPNLAPVQSYLGVLGMTGMTAWVGLKRIANVQPGSTVFVSAASGAVGSVVSQIAKAHDCRVIGSAGRREKIAWLRDKIKLDGVINYKETDNLSETLHELAPNGIDVYFDNVGGPHLEAALDVMNDFGCCVECGMISTYNATQPPQGPSNLFKIITKRIRMQGFIVTDHLADRDEFLRDMSAWIKSGKVIWKETVTVGLDQAPQALIGLFSGDNLGKSLVKLGD